jgi:hypothetical protein
MMDVDDTIKLKNGMKLENHYTGEVIVVEQFKRKGEMIRDEWWPHALLRVLESPKYKEIGKTTELCGFLLSRDWDVVE